MDWLFPPKFRCWNPNPPVWWFQEVGLWEVIRSWGWGPQEWDQCLTRRQQRPSLLCSHRARVRIQREVNSPQLGRGPSPEPDSAGTLSQDFCPSELWEISVCCSSHPVYDVSLCSSLSGLKQIFLSALQSSVSKVTLSHAMVLSDCFAN